MLPVFKQCLAPKKGRSSIGGASALRGSIQLAESAPSVKESDIKASAKKLYAWVTAPKSKIRMLASYQAAGGLSFVTYVYHRSVHAFIKCGEKGYGGGGVSEEDFVNAIVVRHAEGDSGIVPKEVVDRDFGS